MHICLDFIPELISQPDTDKRIFAIQLTSFLSQQYALPKSLGVAKLCMNILNTLLTVLSAGEKPKFYLATLPAVARLCRLFPPLYEDIVALLTGLAKMCCAQLATSAHLMISSALTLDTAELLPLKDTENDDFIKLYNETVSTFRQVTNNAVIVKDSQ